MYELARGQLDGRLPEILARLGDQAEGGDLAAIRLTLEVTGRYVERRAVDVRGTVSTYQAEEYAAAAEFVNDWEKRRFAKVDGTDLAPETLADGSLD